MKDRIQIDGVWYVRETKPESDFLDIKLNTSLSAHYENEDYSWEVIRTYRDDNETFYDGFDVKFIDKNTKPGIEDYWDNMVWFKGVYENNPDSINQALENMDENGVFHFRSFLNRLKIEGWF